MAENTKIGPIFRGANGGISDDLFTGIQNSYYYSDKIEVREDAKSIYPSTVPASLIDSKSYTLTGETDKPVEMFMTKNSDPNLYIFVGKSVFVVDTQLFSNTPTLLCTFGHNICDAETFNGYIYISTTDGLYLISETANSTTWSNLPSETTVTGTPFHGRIKQWNKNTGYHPLYGSETILAVGDYNEMLKIEKETCDTYATGFTLQDGYMIKMITELGGFLRVVADDGLWGSEIIMWDKVTDPEEFIPFTGYKFLQTCVYNGYQYLLSDKGLGVLNGYQYYILKKAQEGGSVESSAKNAMCVFDDKIYFSTSEGIFIYGAKNKNYNDILSQWITMKKCGCLYSNGLNLFTSCGKQDGYSYARAGGFEKGIPTQTGELQTMAYFGTGLSEIKQALYLRLGYKIPKYNRYSGEIHVYYRTDADATSSDDPSDWSWHPVQEGDKGLTAVRDMRSPFATTLKLNCRFQWIQFKFVISNCRKTNSGDNYLYTHLYSADLYYNTMLE